MKESYLLGLSSLNPRIDGQTPVCSSKLGSADHLFEGGKREPGHVGVQIQIQIQIQENLGTSAFSGLSEL